MVFKKQTIIRFAVNVLALEIAAILVKEIQADNLGFLILASLILALLNTFIKPFLIFLTLPLNIITLGSFTLLINGLLLYLASILTPGFHIMTIWGGILGAIIVSLISFILNMLIKQNDF